MILGHVPLIKIKCIPTGIQLRSCCPHAVCVCLFVCFCYMKVKLYNKTLNVWSLGKLVSSVRLRLGKHQDSRENKTNCFPRDHTLSVYCFEYLKPLKSLSIQIYTFGCRPEHSARLRDRSSIYRPLKAVKHLADLTFKILSKYPPHSY